VLPSLISGLIPSRKTAALHFDETDADVPGKRVEPLTNDIYRVVGTPGLCSSCALDTYLVTRTGECISGSNGACLAANSGDARTVYVRQPGTYIAGPFDPGTINGGFLDLFTNELGSTSVPKPKEGFADTFKVHMRSPNGVTVLPSNERRRQFFENNNRFSNWVCALLDESMES
jgi:hypothetical protein